MAWWSPYASLRGANPARTKVQTEGWKWASVNIIAFRKGTSLALEVCDALDHITAKPLINGRRAELPIEVARWMVGPYVIPGGLHLDPFTGSGKILQAAEERGMRTLGYELPDDEVMAA